MHLCSNRIVFLVFYFFPKNSEHSVWFLVILKFLTQFSVLIPECNGLLFPVTELKIGIFNILFFNLFYLLS